MSTHHRSIPLLPSILLTAIVALGVVVMVTANHLIHPASDVAPVQEVRDVIARAKQSPVTYARLQQFLAKYPVPTERQVRRFESTVLEDDAVNEQLVREAAAAVLADMPAASAPSSAPATGPAHSSPNTGVIASGP